MKTLLVTALILLVLIFIYNFIEISRLYVNKPIIHSSKLSQDLRITQISDFHGNRLMDRHKLIDKIIEFNPHIVVLTGDMIDHKTEDIGFVLNLIKGIQEVNNNIFFVIGNHELRNPKGDIFISKLKEIGIILLDNENSVIKVNEDNMNIIGLSFFASKEDYEKTTEEIDNNNFTLLLSHSPNRPIDYASGKEDLILSGHTHGGQVRLPLIGAIVAPGQGFFPEYDKGIFELGDTKLYIDSGLGNSVFPIRFFNRVQISNITVKTIGNN